jgi:Rrf2 family protein
MQITMTAEYAIRALLCLSSSEIGASRRIGDVAAEAEVPESYLRKVIPMLTKAGFVRSSVGVTGGIQLAMLPSEISMLDVFEAVEGKMYLNKCLIHPNVCHRTPFCPMHTVWSEVQESIRQKLASQTLSDIARQNTENLARYKAEKEAAKG